MARTEELLRIAHVLMDIMKIMFRTVQSVNLNAQNVLFSVIALYVLGTELTLPHALVQRATLRISLIRYAPHADGIVHHVQGVQVNA